jgi:hypothetical protein
MFTNTRSAVRHCLTATVTAALAATLAASALVGPASAAPAAAPDLSPAAVAAAMDSWLSSVDPASVKAQPATLRLTRGMTSATIVCTASSLAAIRTWGGWNSVVGKGVSECPVRMDNLVAQTSLFEWDFFVGDWIEVRIGNYANGPGTKAESETGEYTCRDEPRDYVAITFHHARLGNAYATAVTASAVTSCKFV